MKFKSYLTVFFLALMAVSFFGCSQDQAEITITPPPSADDAIEVRSTGFPGRYIIRPTLGEPCYCDYLELNADGSYDQIEFIVNTGWQVKPGGLSGTWSEIDPTTVELTNWKGSATPSQWVDISPPWYIPVLDQQGGNDYLQKFQ